MAQEEHTTRCGNNSGGDGGGGSGGGGVGGGGGHRSLKKLKHKKVPQRGMGVAQLEKIILEEQQKKDVAILPPNSIMSPANSSSCLATIQSVPNFRPPSIPLPPPLPPNHRPLIPKADGTNPTSMSKPATASGGGNNWNRLWTGAEFNPEGENQNQNHGSDHRGYPVAMPANLGGLPYEASPSIWPPLPNITQRSQLFQQPCSSLMVNVSLGPSSSSSSSIMNFQMEPPSNQSYCGNYYPPLWPEEEKMVGMKRSYPFSIENMPIPFFHCKFPSAYVSPISRSDESTSCTNGGTTSLEPSNPVSRENPSSAGAKTDQTTRKFIDENRSLTKDFLTLAPPQASSSSLSSQLQSHSKEKLQPLSIEQPQFEILPPYQGQRRDWSNQQPLHSFFPAAKTPGNNNGEAGESVDLNLKL